MTKRLTVMALRGVPATLEVARDGQEAMDYLTNDGNALPRLVLLCPASSD